MAYATPEDIITLYSEDALYVADRDGDGVVDEAAVLRALTSASGEIDTYIGVRERLPLDLDNAPTAREVLKQFCVDIAVYRLALAREVQTEEHRTRYEDATTHLEKLAKGTAILNLPGPTDPETGEASFTSPRPVVSTGPEREFTRAKMRGH